MPQQQNAEIVGIQDLKELNKTILSNRKIVVVCRRAYGSIKSSLIATENACETGGILLGYRIFNTHIIVAITTADKAKKKDKTSFVLDGYEHTEKVEQIISNYKVKPKVLGVWHSHICDTNTFSKQDRISNFKLAKIFNGVLSMIVTSYEEKFLLTTFFVTQNSEEYLCFTKVVKWMPLK